jgi:transcriptional regulator with AAA-type ATPase domain
MVAAASSVTLSRENAFRGARPAVVEPLLLRVLASDRLLAAPARHRLGESGSGKEVAARAVHALSGRRG